MFTLYFVLVSNLYFTDNVWKNNFQHFEVENEKLDIGSFGVFISSCQDDQNELSNKTFEQI